MMSLEMIHQMNDEATNKAKKQLKRPYIARCDGDVDVRKAPFIGDYIPDGWRRTGNRFFVDNSGFGAPDEPALTFGQFLDRVKAGYGYALVECGQFQIYIDEYVQIFKERKVKA
jgi:hypothetical protein